MLCPCGLTAASILHFKKPGGGRSHLAEFSLLKVPDGMDGQSALTLVLIRASSSFDAAFAVLSDTFPRFQHSLESISIDWLFGLVSFLRTLYPDLIV